MIKLRWPFTWSKTENLNNYGLKEGRMKGNMKNVTSSRPKVAAAPLPLKSKEPKEINVRVDLVDYKSKKAELEKIHSLVHPIDFNKLEIPIEHQFDELNMNSISDEAKKHIIKIVQEDNKYQAEQRIINEDNINKQQMDKWEKLGIGDVDMIIPPKNNK